MIPWISRFSVLLLSRTSGFLFPRTEAEAFDTPWWSFYVKCLQKPLHRRRRVCVCVCVCALWGDWGGPGVGLRLWGRSPCFEASKVFRELDNTFDFLPLALSPIPLSACCFCFYGLPCPPGSLPPAFEVLIWGRKPDGFSKKLYWDNWHMINCTQFKCIICSIDVKLSPQSRFLLLFCTLFMLSLPALPPPVYHWPAFCPYRWVWIFWIFIKIVFLKIPRLENEDISLLLQNSSPAFSCQDWFVWKYGVSFWWLNEIGVWEWVSY